MVTKDPQMNPVRFRPMQPIRQPRQVFRNDDGDTAEIHGELPLVADHDMDPHSLNAAATMTLLDCLYLLVVVSLAMGVLAWGFSIFVH